MKAGTDEAIAYSAETAEKARLDEAQAILQLKRPLLPIDMQLAREFHEVSLRNVGD